MKKLLKRVFNSLGYELYRPSAFPPGSSQRPIGRMNFLLEDLAARGFSPKHVLDVGAHDGSWSRTLAQVFPDVKCYLIEPKVEMEERLYKFCSDHPGSQFHLCAAGATSENRTLTLWPNAGEGTSLLPRENGDLKDRGVQRTVPIVTIDSLIQDGRIESPDLMKVDVEGFEIEVLKGARDALRTSEFVILETSLYERLPEMPLFHEVVAYMAREKFFLYDFPGFHRRPELGVLHVVDVCFIRADSKFRPLIEGLYM